MHVRGLPSFLLALVLVIVLTLAAYLALYATLSGSSLHTPLSAPDKIQSITAILALIFGTSAAVAGAFATIQLANLGLRLSERQNTMDALKFLEERFHTATHLYSNALFALDRLFSCGLSVDRTIPPLSREHAIEQMKTLKPAELAAEMGALNDAIIELMKDLRALATDEFAAYCFAVGAGRMQSQLRMIGNSLAALGIEESEAKVDLENIAGLCALFDVSRRRVRDDTLSSVIEARTFTNSADIALFGKGYNNQSVRSLFFLGNLIFCRSDAVRDGRMFIASYGAAMIHDLIRAMPTGEVIRECLRAQYPEIAPAVERLKQSFHPDQVISSFAKYALDSADKVGGLYLLLSKEPVSIGKEA